VASPHLRVLACTQACAAQAAAPAPWAQLIGARQVSQTTRSSILLQHTSMYDRNSSCTLDRGRTNCLSSIRALVLMRSRRWRRAVDEISRRVIDAARSANSQWFSGPQAAAHRPVEYGVTIRVREETRAHRPCRSVTIPRVTRWTSGGTALPSPLHACAAVVATSPAAWQCTFTCMADRLSSVSVRSGPVRSASAEIVRLADRTAADPPHATQLVSREDLDEARSVDSAGGHVTPRPSSVMCNARDG
jgi:hypothetical protein